MAKGKGSTSVKAPAKVVKAPVEVTVKAPKAVRTQPLNVSSYIVKVSKMANDGVGVRKNVKEHIETLIMSFIRFVNKHAEENLKARKTLQERDVEHAIRVFLPDSPFRDALIARAKTVLETFATTKKADGVNMSIPRTREWLVWGLSDKEKLHVSRNAVVYLAAVLDQFVIELTREANVYSKEKERDNITLPDFHRALKKNAEFNTFLAVFENDIVADDSENDTVVEEAPPVILAKVSKRKAEKV